MRGTASTSPPAYNRLPDKAASLIRSRGADPVRCRDRTSMATTCLQAAPAGNRPAAVGDPAAGRSGFAGAAVAAGRCEPEQVGDRWRSIWPCVETVVPQPEYLPWAEAGGLLARLHREEPAGRIPSHGWPQRLRRAMDALRAQPDATVRRAAAALPDAVWRAGSPDRPATVVHGDFHLGQLGRRDAGAPWVLIDVDDLGVGDPAWDLARPAGFWAAGLIPDARLGGVRRRLPRRRRARATWRRPVAGSRAVRQGRGGAGRRTSSGRRAAVGGLRADG